MAGIGTVELDPTALAAQTHYAEEEEEKKTESGSLLTTTETEPAATKSASTSVPRRTKAVFKKRAYINMKLSSLNIANFEDKPKLEQFLYFSSVAPHKSGVIDLHTHTRNELDLRYCCGLYMKIDKSFTVHTMLSAEFITGLQKMALYRTKKAELDRIEPAFADDMTMATLHKEWKREEHRVCIFIPGYHYTSGKAKAAEEIMNEAIHFYQDASVLVTPFLWPTEGYLISDSDNDTNSQVSEQLIAHELVKFAARLHTYFGDIDFIAHGSGCGVLLTALEQLVRDKVEVLATSHIVCLAPDVTESAFKTHVRNLRGVVTRITLYTNTWDWSMTWSKWSKWTENRAGHCICVTAGLETIDTTDVSSVWFGSNHYYLNNAFVKNDILESLSQRGGCPANERTMLTKKIAKDGTSHYWAILSNEGAGVSSLKRNYTAPIQQPSIISAEDDTDSALVQSNDRKSEAHIIETDTDLVAEHLLQTQRQIEENLRRLGFAAPESEVIGSFAMADESDGSDL